MSSSVARSVTPTAEAAWAHGLGVPTTATSLESVLGLEIFRRAEAFVAAGSHLLDRRVRWVHAAEIPDIAKFLNGGELLLTAGHGIGHSSEDQRAYVASIAGVNVAGLAVELTGRVYDKLPDGLVEAADKYGVPLIGLKHEIPFVEASAQVLQLLTRAAMDAARRTVEANQELTARLAEGADYVELVRAVSESVARPIVLESADHQVQASFGESTAVEELVEDWNSHARSVALHEEAVDSPPQCLRRPVVVQGATWGFVHMPGGRQHSHVDQVIVESGASAVAISLLNERVSGARSRHQQGVLINRLMVGDISGTAFVERALRLGQNLRRSSLVIVIVGTHDESVTDLERQVNGDLKRTRLACVSADIGDAVLSVVGLRSERSLGVLTTALGGESRYVGISKVVSASDLPAAVQQAKAASMARQPLQLFDNLGILRLLVPLSNGPDLAAFVEDELGAVLAHDAKHQTPLYETLLAFLRNDGNKTMAAKELFVQRRTLYYRLEKLGRILDLDLEDVEDRIRLQVAARASELLRNSRRPGTAPAARTSRGHSHST